MTEYSYVEHTFEPIYDKHSKILILGTFPSVKSRENQFYYGHPQNRFWKVIAQVTGEAAPLSIEERTKTIKNEIHMHVSALFTLKLRAKSRISVNHMYFSVLFTPKLRAKKRNSMNHMHTRNIRKPCRSLVVINWNFDSQTIYHFLSVHHR